MPTPMPPALPRLLLEIYHDGTLRETVDVPRDDRAIVHELNRRPPTAARGGVARVVNHRTGRAITYALSGHSTRGPRWTPYT